MKGYFAFKVSCLKNWLVQVSSFHVSGNKRSFAAFSLLVHAYISLEKSTLRFGYKSYYSFW